MGKLPGKTNPTHTLEVVAPDPVVIVDDQGRASPSAPMAPMMRSSSHGAIHGMEDGSVSVSDSSGAGGLRSARDGDEVGVSGRATDVSSVGDRGGKTNGSDNRVTPPTIPTLDVARAAATQYTAPPATKHTAREWEGRASGEHRGGGRAGFLSERQRSPAVHDSARSAGHLSHRLLDGGRGGEGGGLGLRPVATPRSTCIREEVEFGADSVGSIGSHGSFDSQGASASRASLRGFLAGELFPQPVYHTADAFWGQTERDRVYNALWYVPYQLERLIGLGNAICMQAFLGIFTMLPLRVGSCLVVVAGAFLSNVGLGRHPESPVRVPKKTLLRGDQIYDLICASIFVVMTMFLWHIQAGAIYFWVKEMTHEFLKLSVLHTALELGDKICCSFGIDVLEALAASCTTLSTNPTMRNARHVVADAMVALMLLMAHAGALMCQALVYGVAMNSKKNSLLALLIASNFTEIKGTVFKRFDPTKIFTLTCQDIVERFHLYVIMSFVLVEESVGSGQPLPSPRLVVQCLYVLFAEIIIDVTKHAVLGKFNDIRPGVYAEFTKDLCENLEGTQSHTVHKLVGIEPFASAALFFRVFVSFAALQRDLFLQGRGFLVGIICAAMWFGLIATAVLFGYAIRSLAAAYLREYTQTSNSRRVKRAVSNTANKKAV